MSTEIQMEQLDLRKEPNTVIIGGQEFPSKCPEKCLGNHELFMQGGLCHRCPIFNCTGEFLLLEPDDYRKDWAKAWKEWFDSGMKGLPELYFEESHEQGNSI